MGQSYVGRGPVKILIDAKNSWIRNEPAVFVFTLTATTLTQRQKLIYCLPLPALQCL